MTDKELRRLKRAELLEILYYLQKENEELKAEIAQLKAHSPENGGLSEGFLQQMQTMIREAVGRPQSQSNTKRNGAKGNGKKH